MVVPAVSCHCCLNFKGNVSTGVGGQGGGRVGVWGEGERSQIVASSQTGYNFNLKKKHFPTFVHSIVSN